MKIEPVKDISTPRYPDKYAREVRNALAAAHPQRWRNKSLVVGALAATVAIGLSDCSYGAEGAPVMPPEQVATRGDITTTNTSAVATLQPIGVTLNENTSLPAGIIPLFEYGYGIGAFGCVSSTAPYFMSEDEAFAIMKAAFAKAKIELSKNIKGQQIILPLPTNVIAERGDNDPETLASSLMLDGFADGMPVEFVSGVDVVAWKYDSHGTVSYYRTKSAAQTLAENNPGLVVFYDPVSHFKFSGFASNWKMKKARRKSEQQLRNQVRAFIEWLNAEGMR